MGESGSGKTTTALSLMRLLQEPAVIEGGEVLLDGVDLLRLSEEEMRLARFADIALIPQGAMNSLNPMMKIGEQLRDTIRAHHGHDVHAAAWKPASAKCCVGRPGPGVIGSYPHELSGGMKQRVCIAMAILLQSQGHHRRRTNQRPGRRGPAPGDGDVAAGPGSSWARR